MENQQREFRRWWRSQIDRSFDHYPSELRDRIYRYPKGYPTPEDIRDAVVGPLAVYTSGFHREMNQGEREGFCSQFMTRFKAWAYDHPIYLLSRPLVGMLAETARIEDPNIDTDSCPPYPAAHLVFPSGLVGVPTGAHVRMMTYAVLDYEDYEATGFIRPDMDRHDRRFYVDVSMSDGTAYHAKLEVDADGRVASPDDLDYTDTNMSDAVAQSKLATVVYPDGPDMVTAMANMAMSLCTYLNMERPQPAELVRRTKANRKKELPPREIWTPARIGLGLRPTGIASHERPGGHASPHSHLRRGHWRRARYGPGREQSRRVWIRPTLVNPLRKTEQHHE